MLCRPPYKGNVNLVPLNKLICLICFQPVQSRTTCYNNGFQMWPGNGCALDYTAASEATLIGNALFSTLGNSGFGRTRFKDAQLP